MVPDLHGLPFFTHDHESVKRKSVSREMRTFLEVKPWRLRRKTYEVNDVRDKNPAGPGVTEYIASKKTFRESFLFCPLKANT